MNDADRSQLSPLLRDAVRQLRRAPEPRDIWRQRLLRRVASTEQTGRDVADAPPTRWRLTIGPFTALAAGLVCALIGAGVYSATRPSQGSETRSSVAAGAVAPNPRVRFTLAAPGAAHVAIVGDFNGWNPAALPMRRAADGVTWEIEVPLSPGRYAYSFVVDGQLARDPVAPRAGDEDFGSPSSIVLVTRAGS